MLIPGLPYNEEKSYTMFCRVVSVHPAEDVSICFINGTESIAPDNVTISGTSVKAWSRIKFTRYDHLRNELACKIAWRKDKMISRLQKTPEVVCEYCHVNDIYVDMNLTSCIYTVTV